MKPLRLYSLKKLVVILIDNCIVFPLGVYIGYLLGVGSILQVVWLILVLAALSSISTLVWLNILEDMHK